jgi:hypothetical protein
VIAEEGSAAVAMRADRTPPQPVVTLNEIGELGVASSLGDAEAEAAAAASEALAAREERVARVLAARGKTLDDELKRQLIELVSEAVLSEVATARQRGQEIGPLLAWQELKRDPVHGFGYIDEFAARLGVDVNSVVPTMVDGATARLTRQEAGERLFALIEQWKARAAG